MKERKKSMEGDKIMDKNYAKILMWNYSVQAAAALFCNAFTCRDKPESAFTHTFYLPEIESGNRTDDRMDCTLQEQLSVLCGVAGGSPEFINLASDSMGKYQLMPNINGGKKGVDKACGAVADEFMDNDSFGKSKKPYVLRAFDVYCANTGTFFYAPVFINKRDIHRTELFFPLGERSGIEPLDITSAAEEEWIDAANRYLKLSYGESVTVKTMFGKDLGGGSLLMAIMDIRHRYSDKVYDFSKIISCRGREDLTWGEKGVFDTLIGDEEDKVKEEALLLIEYCNSLCNIQKYEEYLRSGKGLEDCDFGKVNQDYLEAVNTIRERGAEWEYTPRQSDDE